MRKLIILLISVLCAASVNSKVEVHIERLQCISLGEQVEIGITLENPSPGRQMGGFDFLLRYDSALTLLTVEMGQLISDCQWEYFTFTQINNYTERMIAIADLNDGSHHPVCYGASSGVLAEMIFLVTNEESVIGDFLPIRWIWYDCGDNTVSSRSGDTLLISDEVYDFDGDSEYVITGEDGFPTLRGAPGECLGGGNGVERSMDFYNGGVDITGNDMENPVAYCPGDQVLVNDPGQCGAVAVFSATASDNCPGVTIDCIPPSETFFAVGRTTVSCIAVDASGNVDTCRFDVIVNDTAFPVAYCASDTVVGNDPGECGAVVDFDVTMSDNCTGTIHCTPVPGAFFPVGTTSVTCIAVDGSGHGDVCSLAVTVNDTESPIASCPADIVVGNDPGLCGAVVSFDISATDNCSGVTVIATPPSGSLFDIGTTPVWVVATDIAGNADTCQFQVTVSDTTKPVVVCPADIEVPNDSGRYGAVVDFDLFATDNCPGVVISVDPPSGTLFPIGTTPVQAIATDTTSHADTCSFNVTVLLNDPDGDGLPDWDDNCPDIFNPDQIDSDSDGFGDSCDACTDLDGDGFGDPGFPANTCDPDNCPSVSNPDQGDADLDGIGDSCDTCTDTDNDGYGDPGYPLNTCGVDNCPHDYNPDQDDTDGDGIGDACCCVDRGNVDGLIGPGGPVDISDLTYFVSYLFKSGPCFPCPEQANVDGLAGAGGPIDVADLTYLVVYLFKHGSSPPACP